MHAASGLFSWSVELLAFVGRPPARRSALYMITFVRQAPNYFLLRRYNVPRALTTLHRGVDLRKTYFCYVVHTYIY